MNTRTFVGLLGYLGLLTFHGNASGVSPQLTPKIPPKPQTCPDFESGDVNIVPQKLGKPRKARLWMDESSKSGGPIVVFYHGMGGSVMDAERVLSLPAIESILAEGGMVIAPYSEGLNFEWHLVVGTAANDLYLMDDLISCAVHEAGMDQNRIYLTGFSAGALNVSRMIYLRSEYITAASIYSGGFLTFRDEPINSVPSHKFPVLLFHGGSDKAVFIDFRETTLKMHANLETFQHPHAVCDHGKGHKIPDQDGLTFAWQFLSSQSYGDAVAVAEPDYCSEFYGLD